MKYDPTRQHKKMYDELNSGGTGHSVVHKDLNAKAPDEFNRHPIEYSSVHDKVNAKSPVTIGHIDGYKATRGHVSPDNNNASISMTLGNTSGDFSTKQIPNTSPKFRSENDLSVTQRSLHEKSKSMIFHA